MKLALRRPITPGNDPEFFFGVLFIPLWAMGSLLILRLSSRFPLFCLFHRFTGFPCPACGSYRCAKQLMAGQFHEAWTTQPLTMILVGLAIIYAVYSWVVVLFKLPRVRILNITRAQRWGLAGLAIAVILINWAYIALHGI